MLFRSRIFGPEDLDTLGTMSNLAIVLGDERKFAEAEKIHREVLEKEVRLLGPEHRTTASTMTELALDLQHQGRYAEAEKLAREAVVIEQRVEGPENPGYLGAERSLANVLAAEGHYQDAERLYRELIRTATNTNAVSMLAISWYDLACMSAKAGRHDEAFEYLGDAVNRGFGRPEWIAADSDLTSLHGDPRFDALLAKARQTATR